MKIIILVAAFVFSASFAQANVFDRLDDCVYSCSERCERLTERLQEKIDFIVEECGDNGTNDQFVFQESYKFLYSSNGANLSRSSARAYATKVTEMARPKQSLACLKSFYPWAYGSNGADLSRSGALSLTMELIAIRRCAKVEKCFRKAYEFASSRDGMNLSRSSSISHARQTCF